ncbi:MAG: hypothetical protein HYX81_00085 [Chloroflexi bacterium]|nr:hypothetical protein [Chloroflexota bacterium]
MVYFTRPGRDNTEETFRISKARAEELGIKTILIASTRGDSAARAAEFFNGCKIVAVSHAAGWREPNGQEFTAENRQKLEAKGGIVLTAAHALRGGVAGAIRKKFNMRLEADVIADTLRIFGAGMKVVVEIAMMAADAGLARTDEEVIAIAGTGGGADTAVVLKPVNSLDFFDMKVKEILCKPY